jgi:anti-sigma B factor antagonist
VDTTTAPELEAVIKQSLAGVTELNIDRRRWVHILCRAACTALCQKTMNKKGKMKVTHVSENIMEIFEVTGFSDILTIV